MIGYYVHHHGRGHLHRALAVERELGEPVTILSSLAPPPGRVGAWVRLERDDSGPERVDPTAHERLHWVPTGDRGLSRRMHQLSAWLDAARPRLLVADVSVEVALLARLHGVPVVSVALPGRRDDPAHRLGFDVSDVLVGAWPSGETRALLPGLPTSVTGRVRGVGALGRFPVAPRQPRRPGPSRVLVLGGAGGSTVELADLERAASSAPDWEWTICGPPGPWRDDAERLLREADVVICHAGQNVLAEVASARRPAIVVPQPRPHDEQLVTAAALRADRWPAIVEDAFPASGWADRLDRALRLDGSGWSSWCDGRAGRRFAEVLAGVGVRQGVA